MFLGCLSKPKSNLGYCLTSEKWVLHLEFTKDYCKLPQTVPSTSLDQKISVTRKKNKHVTALSEL